VDRHTRVPGAPVISRFTFAFAMAADPDELLFASWLLVEA
jgi:hypothetical protein